MRNKAFLRYFCVCSLVLYSGWSANAGIFGASDFDVATIAKIIVTICCRCVELHQKHNIIEVELDVEQICIDLARNPMIFKTNTSKNHRNSIRRQFRILTDRIFNRNVVSH